MSNNTIDLTSESPPRSGLALPRGTQLFLDDNARAGPSNISRSTAGSGRNTRQTVQQRQRQRQIANSTPATGLGPSSRATNENDGFELTGMSEGARARAEAVQRQVEASRIWRRNFLNAHNAQSELAGTPQEAADGDIQLVAPPQNDASANVRIRDHLGPGPHRRAQPQRRAAAAANNAINNAAGISALAFPTVRASDVNLASQAATRVDATRMLDWSAQSLLRVLRDSRWIQPLSAQSAGGQWNTHQRGGQFAPLPEKHNPKYVINRSKDKPDANNFTYAIVEPPVDVETYDQDPRIITGPLPATSAICAGCDCALVRGGQGKRKLWAFPCGHVFDGRCYDRYCVGIKPLQARRMARQDIKEEEAVAVAEDTAPTATEPISNNGNPAAAALAAGTKRLASDAMKDDQSEVEATLGKSPPSKIPRLSREAPESAADDDDDSSMEHEEVAAPAQRQQRASSHVPPPSEYFHVIPPAMTKEPPKVKYFRCPVDGCQQRIATTPGKPSSALELYM